MPRMTSHELAFRMQRLAEWLLERPEFFGPHDFPTIDIFYGEKDEFLAAARALGAGDKRSGGASGDIFVFRPHTPEGTRLEINISRDKVCHKVQDAVWECEALLSREEEAQVGADPKLTQAVERDRELRLQGQEEL